MANKLTLKRSAVPGKVPTTADLDLGEIAINTYDGKAYMKKNVSGVESIVLLVGAGSGDVNGPAASADNALARFDGTSGKLIQNSSATVDDNGNLSLSSTGFLKIPAGTTAQRPASPQAGYTRLNTSVGSIEFYDGANWIYTNLIPFVNSVSGTIWAGITSNLTLSVTGYTDKITVRFSEGGSVLADVTDVTVTAGSATVAVPAAVYGQLAGDTIAVSVINQDGTPSSNSISKTVVGLPTGGTITTAGGYRVHKFNSSGTFVVPANFSQSVQYLVVAGGGGGGPPGGGGGGGGGYRCSVTGESSGGGASAESPLSLTAGSYTVTIGAGGTGGGYQTSDATPGGNSVFGSITSLGGGGGGQNASGSLGYPSGGGSGGGTGGRSATPGSGTSGQGYAGGNANLSYPGAYGGGGGAAAVGQTAPSTTVGGAGGNGVASSIDGTSTYRAGGGGGGTYGGGGGTAGGAGGLGGGVAGTTGGTPSAASANTGGGGGGNGAGAAAGGVGGSGVVIVRYLV